MRTLIIATLTVLPTLSFAQNANETLRLNLGNTPVEQETYSPLTTAQAQQTVTAEDRDGILACSLIYQRVSDLYKERNEQDQADSFIGTAYAYSQTSDILFTQEMGAEQAYDVITERMSLISDSLNRESQDNPKGDLGVIENWLGWCDSQGEFVQNTIDTANNPEQ